MKKISILTLAILSFNTAKSQADNPLFKLGVSIDSVSHCNECEVISIDLGLGGIKPGLSCRIQGVLFSILYQDDRKIVAYYTLDSLFQIRNYRYLTKDRKIVDSLKKDKIIFTDLFQGAYLNLPDGWRLGFLEQDIITENGVKQLRKNAMPGYLYKTSLITEFSLREQKRLVLK